MSNRTRKTARRAAPALASVAALGALAVLPTAGDAAVRHVPGAGNGLQITTDAPDLRSVKVSTLNRATFCFDQPVVNFTNNGYFLQTYDASRYNQSTSAVLDPTNPNCVVAQFTGDNSQVTVASTGANAARDSAGRGSLPASEPFQGPSVTPRPGATTGPDLVSASADLTNNSITYTFDETLADADVTPGSFSYTNENGQSVAGTTQISRSGNTVIVGFPGAVTSAARAAVDAGAVTDVAQSGTSIDGRSLATPNGAAAVGINGKGDTGAPILTGATGGPKEWVLTYSSDIGDAQDGRIRAVLDNGTTVTATDVTRRTGSTTQQTAIFPDAIGTEPGAIVRIVDLGGRAAGEGVFSGASAVSTATPNDRAGFTNAPDLLAASRDDASGRINYTFDEPVAAAAAGGFFASPTSGNLLASAGGTTLNGPSVAVTFSQAARTSTGVAITGGAATDGYGNASPSSSIAYATEAQPQPNPNPNPNPTPTGTTPAPTPTPTPTPTAKPRTKTSVSIRRTSTRITGTVKNSGRGCQVGRKVSLKRIGRSKALKTTSTNSKGVYRFKRSSSTRGKKVRVVVAARTGTYAICGSKTSKTIKG